MARLPVGSRHPTNSPFLPGSPQDLCHRGVTVEARRTIGWKVSTLRHRPSAGPEARGLPKGCSGARPPRHPRTIEVGVIQRVPGQVVNPKEGNDPSPNSSLWEGS